MSATGRPRSDGTSTSREQFDAYTTPAWCVRSFLESAGDRLFQSPSRRWHEVAVGDGAIIRAVDAAVSPDRRPTWIATDVRDVLDAPMRDRVRDVYIGDYLQRPSVNVDVIFTNPPFVLAVDFLRKARKEAEVVCFLLRINVLAPNKYSHYLRDDMPDLYVLPNRPIFGRGASGLRSTDATEYAWMVWEGKPRSCGAVTVLPLVPKGERR